MSHSQEEIIDNYVGNLRTEIRTSRRIKEVYSTTGIARIWQKSPLVKVGHMSEYQFYATSQGGAKLVLRQVVLANSLGNVNVMTRPTAVPTTELIRKTQQTNTPTAHDYEGTTVRSVEIGN